MNKKRNSTILLLVIIVVMVVALFGYKVLGDRYGAETADGAGAQSDLTPAKSFTMENSEGKTVSLEEHFGKPIFLNFWASWCPPCQQEMPYIQKVYEEYGDKVDFIMVDLVDPPSETEEKAKEFAEDNGYTFPIYFDTARNGSGTYQVYNIPTTVVIDKDGNIVTTHTGAMDEATVRRYVESVL